MIEEMSMKKLRHCKWQNSLPRYLGCISQYTTYNEKITGANT